MTVARNIIGRFQELPARARYIILGVAITTLVVMVLIVRAATSMEMVVLAEGDPREIGQMETVLEDAGVRYDVARQGTQVLVRGTDRDLSSARVALADAGLLSGSGNHYTYEKLIEEQGGRTMGMTEQEWELNRQRLLEGLIAADIERMNGIRGASVRLTQPDDALFRSEQATATAAVTIDTGNEGVSEAQVRAIRMLVSHAVENLSASDVAIIDQDGNAVSEGGSGGDSVFTGAQAVREVERRFNAEQESRLNAHLQRIAGQDNVTALLNTNLDLDSVEEQIQQFGGEENLQGPIRQTQVATEDLQVDGGTTVGGVAGVGTNVGGNNNQFAGLLPTEGQDTNFASTDTATVYDNDSITQMVQRAPGLVNDMSLSIVANQDLPAETLAAVDNVARTFLGKAQDQAGNTYSMTTAPLPQVRDLEAEALQAARRDAIIGYLKWLLLGLGLVFVALALRRQLADRTMELLEAENELLTLDDGFDPIPLAELDASFRQEQLGNAERMALQRRVERIAKDKPDETALLVRSWLHER